MATCNFGYNNRCVIVTDNDFEFGNIPSIGSHTHLGYRDDYRVLDDFDNFNFWVPVLGFGYYEDGYIDYIEKDFEDDWRYIDYVESKNKLAQMLYEDFGASLNRSEKTFRKHMENTNTIEEAFDKCFKWMREVEEKQVNKVIDGIAQSYGYQECRRVATFSNGEAIYQLV